MKCTISLLTARNSHRGIQSCVLFVEGAQQVLKWQIASRATWINIDSGLVSPMRAQAGVIQSWPKRVTEGQVM